MRYYEQQSDGTFLERSRPLALAQPTSASDVTPAVAPMAPGFDAALVLGNADGSLQTATCSSVTRAGSAGLECALRPDQTFPLSQVSVQAASAPTFADFDGDGLVDLLLGQRNGEILFVRNVGSAAQPQFGSGGCTVGVRAGPVDCARVNDAFRTGNGWSSPVAGDLDQDGDADVIVGGADGSLRYLENLRDANASGYQLPSFAEVSGPQGPFGAVGLIAAGYARPALVDLDSDGDLDLLVGAADGSLLYFENVGGARGPPRFASNYTAPLGLSTLMLYESVRLQISLAGAMEDIAVIAGRDEAAQRICGAINATLDLPALGLTASTFQLAPGSILATFDIAVSGELPPEQMTMTPFDAGVMLACVFERVGGAPNGTAWPFPPIASSGVHRVLAGGNLVRLSCPSPSLPPPFPPYPPPSPPWWAPTPPLNPPYPVLSTISALDSGATALSTEAMAAGSIAALVFGILLCCCCVLLLVGALLLKPAATGLLGPRTQLMVTHDDPTRARPLWLYLPAEQREAVKKVADGVAKYANDRDTPAIRTADVPEGDDAVRATKTLAAAPPQMVLAGGMLRKNRTKFEVRLASNRKPQKPRVTGASTQPARAVVWCEEVNGTTTAGQIQESPRSELDDVSFASAQSTPIDSQSPRDSPEPPSLEQASSSLDALDERI